MRVTAHFLQDSCIWTANIGGRAGCSAASDLAAALNFAVFTAGSAMKRMLQPLQ